jgi:hypothetical protein
MVKAKTSKKTNSQEDKNKFEEFKLNGHELVNKIKELIKAGNIRRIIIKNEKGKVMMEIPITIAVVGTVFAPILAAVGALAALLSKCSLVVEKK